MHTTPDPLAVLQVAIDHNISEEQAATALEWAARMTVHAWETHAYALGLEKGDGDAMEAWFRSLALNAQTAVLDDAVTAVVGADNVLAEVYREHDIKQGRRARIMRTNRRRVHIR
ncbi:hypothetical protein ACO0M4_11945 [Streptomyces sp. RGM 3693]|uniref:hypothetical protein n=1 Tax=Streptomyces sp. RGM 3693 TaxID=3413284 RepID=UPI003D26B6A9